MDERLPIATIAITTKNRRDDLRRAVQSACNQVGPCEVIVIDDGSEDGTSEMIRREFPSVRLERHEKSAGLIVRRNRAAELATTPFVFSIDDDAALVSPNTVDQALKAFSSSEVAAITVPYREPLKTGALILQAPPESSGEFVVAAFRGTAHALRREVFLSIGGYREQLFHQGEEPDLCIRLLDRGYRVAVGRADPLEHYESPRRDSRRMDIFGRRNDVLFAWHNVPWPALPIHLFGTTLKGLWFGLRSGRLGATVRGLLLGWLAIPGEWANRRAVSFATYRQFRALRKRGPLRRRLEQSEGIVREYR